MNEHVARDIVLVRAIETADQKREILTEDDRMYAARGARELAQWQAADMATRLKPEHFFQHRAELLLKKISQRHPAFASATRPQRWPSLMLILVPIISLFSGIAADRIGNPHHVDLLSGPLLAIIGWNLLAYAVMLFARILPGAGISRFDGGLLHSLSQPGKTLPRKLPGVLSTALTRFAAEWARLNKKLTQARWRRTLHLGAALFASGAIISLYARGMLSEYRAGWESTFLNAAQVHSLLSMLFAPAIAVFPLQPFTLADVQDLHFSQKHALGHGARWVHLYASTLFLIVVVPRAALAALAHWRTRRLERNFPLDMEQPYFRQFNADLDGKPMTLRVIPYSFHLDQQREKNLETIAVALLGQQTRLVLGPSLAYGEEQPAETTEPMRQADAQSMSVVLFSLAATPEKETHGAILKHLAQHSHGGMTALIDESTYQEKMGTGAQAKVKLAERIQLWQQFCDFHHVPATIVNLLDPDNAHGRNANLEWKRSETP